MKTNNFSLTYGLLTGLVVILFAVLLHISGLYLHKVYSMIIILPFITGILLCCINYAKAKDGFVTFGQIFTKGFVAALIVAGMVTIWTILSFYLWPNMPDEVAENARKEMARTAEVNKEAVDFSIGMMKRWMFPIAILTASLGYTFMGAICSLIGAGLAKKSGQPRELLDPTQSPDITQY